MADAHQGKKHLVHTFNEVVDFLAHHGEQHLSTKSGAAFVARTETARRGWYEGQVFIKIMGVAGSEYARIYECCWGYGTNVYGTRIGGYSEALDELLR